MNELYNPAPMQQAEQVASLDIDKAIADVPPFTITIDLDDCQGTVVIDSGLEETKIVKGTTLHDPVAIMKVILAAQDTLAAITPSDVRKQGFKPRKNKQRVSRIRSKGA